MKEQDEDGNDDDDDDNDNDNDNNSKDKQKDNGTATNHKSSNQSQSDNTSNNENQESQTNTGNSTTGTQHSATQFTFNTPITPVNALSSPQSPTVEHPTPPMRSPASPIGSVTYSSGASSTGTDHFSCVIQTPGTSFVASDQVHCEVTRKPIEMGKNDYNSHHQQTPQFTTPTTTQYTRRVIYSGNITTTNTARPEVRGKPGDKKAKKKNQMMIMKKLKQ